MPIYTSSLSLHDALPIYPPIRPRADPLDRTDTWQVRPRRCRAPIPCVLHADDRSEEHTSDSSHVAISYAVFCLKKKMNIALVLIHVIAHTCTHTEHKINK